MATIKIMFFYKRGFLSKQEALILIQKKLKFIKTTTLKISGKQLKNIQHQKLKTEQKLV